MGEIEICTVTNPKYLRMQTNKTEKLFNLILLHLLNILSSSQREMMQ